MDLAFRRGRRLRPADRVALDQQRLVAALSAAQAASATARAMTALDGRRAAFAGDRAALAEIYLAGRRWHEAATALRHGFRSGGITNVP